MSIEEAKWITNNIIEDIESTRIPFDLWCNYKNIALRVKENCKESSLGICLYSTLYNRFYSLSVFYREMGHQILKCESFSDEIMLEFEKKYVKPYFNINEY